MIRIIRARSPGSYSRPHVFYNGRWVRWVGFAALPIGRRWLGLAIETPTGKPGAVRSYYKHGSKSGHSYRVCYDPMTGRLLDE